MRIWAEIYNGAQTRLLGVATLAGASIVQALDKAGSMTLDVPATDPQAVALMQWGRWVYVYTDTPRTRRVGRRPRRRRGRWPRYRARWRAGHCAGWSQTRRRFRSRGR